MKRVDISAGQGSGVKYITLPCGILAHVTVAADGSVHWDQLLLGKNGDNVVAFNNPPDKLVAAMQANEFFWVACNADYLGDFANSVTIDGWEMTAAVGDGQGPGEYANVMIIKACKGALCDLIADTETWTSADYFSVPQADGAKAAAPVIALSQWLQSYFKNAQEQPEEYFGAFNTIAQNPSWNGILFVRVNITGVPPGHAGILEEIGDPANFNAHHVGIELNPVTSDPNVVPDSSFFGLIYYTDAGAQKNQDSKLLALKVLFENSAVTALDIVQN